MGNCWKGISEEQLTDTEKRMLTHSDIPLEEFEFKNVVVDEITGDYVRTIEVGNVSGDSIFILTNFVNN